MKRRQSRAFAQKYKNGMKVGGYEILMAQGAARDSDTVIFDKSGKLVFWMSYDELLETSVMYFNVNGDFTTLHYKHDFTGSPIEYSAGSIELGEYKSNPRGDYIRKEDGSYRLYQEETGKEFIQYDEAGNIISRQDYKTGITYDGQDDPIAKRINTTDKVGLHASVPYDVAEEIQQLVDKNNGSFNAYNEKTGCYTSLPELTGGLLYPTLPEHLE